MSGVLALVLMMPPSSGLAARQSEGQEGFTFFEIGASTRYSESLRAELEDRLGNDAIQRQNIIDLEVHPFKILNTYFPKLDELNRRLNSSLGERIEHDTLKLMYRYARNKDLPFSYVEILFSNQSELPLHIRVESRTDISAIRNTLIEKYGPSRTIEWDAAEGSTDIWRHGNDVLLFSSFPNKAGVMQFRIAIYYVDNINQMLEREKVERKSDRQERKQAGGSAF